MELLPVGNARDQGCAGITATGADTHDACCADTDDGGRIGGGASEPGAAAGAGEGAAGGEGEAAADGFAVEATAIGPQTLVPGVAPITARDRLAWRAAAPLEPKKPQRACDLGLFDLNARNQLELFQPKGL